MICWNKGEIIPQVGLDRPGTQTDGDLDNDMGRPSRRRETEIDDGRTL